MSPEVSDALEAINSQGRHRGNLWLKFYEVAFEQGTTSDENEKQAYEKGGKARMKELIREANNQLKDDSNPDVRTNNNQELSEIYKKAGEDLGFAYYYLNYSKENLIDHMREGRKNYINKWITEWKNKDYITDKTIARVPQVYNRNLCDICERLAKGGNPERLKDTFLSNIRKAASKELGGDRKEKIRKAKSQGDENYHEHTDSSSNNQEEKKNNESNNSNDVEIEPAVKKGIEKMVSFIQDYSNDNRYKPSTSPQTRVLQKSFREDKKNMLEAKLIEDLKEKKNQSTIKQKLKWAKEKVNRTINLFKEEGKRTATRKLIKQLVKQLKKVIPRTSDVIEEMLRDLKEEPVKKILKSLVKGLFMGILGVL